MIKLKKMNKINKRLRSQNIPIPVKFWEGLWNPITGQLPGRILVRSIYRDRSLKNNK